LTILTEEFVAFLPQSKQMTELTKSVNSSFLSRLVKFTIH
jgi:hypothetical protein